MVNLNFFQLEAKKITLLLFLICFQIWGQNIEEVQLMHWSSKAGLLSNEVTDFTQDYKGFLWVATDKGINRFDGESFLTFKIKTKEKSEEGIKRLLSYKNSIYLLTNSNAFFQIDTDDFSQKIIDTESLSDDKLKDLLLGFNGIKEVVYNGDNFKIAYTNNLYRNNSIVAGNFNNLYKDTRNRLWVSSIDQGMGYWDSEEEKIKYVVSATKLSELYIGLFQFSTEKETFIVEDKNERIWFYRGHEAIGFWDYEMNNIYTIENVINHPYLKNAYKVFSILIDTELKSLFVDDSGNLWIGTLFNGMFRIRFKPQAFQFYEFDYSSKIGLADADVSSPLPLRNGDIWIGTWGGGINILKEQNLKSSSPDFDVISPSPGMDGALQEGQVFPVFEDSNENIWAGTSNSGLYVLSKINRKKEKLYFKNYNTKQGVIPSDSIMHIYEDRKKTVWISTVRGLTRYFPNKKIFESTFSELENPDIFKDIYILSVYEDSRDNLWISTDSNGLFKWNKKNNEVDHILKFDDFSTNSIFHIVEESNKSLWFSGLHGVFHFDSDTNTFDYKITTEKFPTDHVESMILGADGLLWLGTDKGLFIYDPQTSKIINVNLPVGLRVNSFTRGVSKDANGYFYFGTRNGFYRFNPNKLITKKNIAPAFTDLKINGSSYRYNDKNKLINEDISTTPNILLKYNQNTFSINYRNLNFYNEDGAFFETSMTKQGEQENWTTTYDTSESWTNLNDGNYTFKVRNSIDSQVSELNIIISPPWWKSSYAFAVYLVFFVVSSYFLIQVFTKRAVTREKKIQDDKFDKLRFKFFLNIAHEIRTPLTLIKGGVERLKERKAVLNPYEKDLERVYKNTDRLTRLVDEVLDLRRIERTDVQLNLSSVNLKWFLENIIDVFRFRENETNLILNTPKEPVWINSDKQLLESIVYNLISNAIKYSNSNSKIEITLFKPTSKEISIQVKDNGFGIKKEEQQLIFERLYQSDEHLKTGTGIGLAIVKQYVGLLSGCINLKSDINIGSVFTVTFPYNDEYSKQDTLSYVPNNFIVKKKYSSTILIVDDQKELRTFIREAFENEFNVFEASNGLDGLRIARKQQPTLIISDVMMPIMDGIEFSKKVRNDISISHTPIVLLTAKTGEKDEIEGLLSGADAYVNKPFSLKVLKSRVDILIENRKKLIKKYSLSIEENLTVLGSNPIDRDFLEKFEKVLSNQFMFSDLSMEELASEMSMSASGFYKKVKSVTGSSPVEFVRTYRLKKGAQLLKSTNITVTEVSEKTGFGTQQYFSNSFRNHFGVSPLEYRKGKKR